MNFSYSRRFCRLAWMMVLVALTGCGGAGGDATDDSPAAPLPEPGPRPTSSIPTVGTAKKLASFDGDASAPRIALDDRPSATVYVTWNQNDGVKNDLYLTRFVSSNGFWDLTPEKLNTSDSGASGAGEMVVNRQGSVAVVWPEPDDNGRHALWSRYHGFSERGWRLPEALGGASSGDAGRALMVVESANRYVVVVWPQDGGDGGRLWANRYNVDPGGGWEGAESIDAGDGPVGEVLLVIDDQNTATAIWTQHDGTRYNLWARRHDSGTGWAAAQKLDTEDLGDVSAPQAVIDADGNMTLVWLQNDGDREHLWAIHHNGAVWQSAAEIGVAPGVANPKLVVDADGNVTVAWVQLQLITGWGDVWAQRYLPGDGWDTPVSVSTVADGVAELAWLTADSTGNVVAIWREKQRTGYQDIWANRYAVASGWGVAGEVENLNNGDAGMPIAGIDSSGDITLVWRHRHEGGDHLVSTRYRSTTDRWGRVTKVESAYEAGGIEPHLVVDRGGDATVVWLQPVDNRYEVWGNRF